MIVKQPSFNLSHNAYQTIKNCAIGVMPRLIWEYLHGEYNVLDCYVWHLIFVQCERKKSSLVLQNGRVRINYSPFVFICAHFFNMPCENVTRVGFCVSGKIGDLPGRADKPRLPNWKWRMRVQMQATGTVICKLGHRRWQVRLDSNAKVVSAASTALKVIDNEEGLPLVITNYYLLYRLYYNYNSNFFNFLHLYRTKQAMKMMPTKSMKTCSC